MSALAFLLEDHFSDVAERRAGSVMGWLSRCLARLLGNIGDLLQVATFRSH